MKNNMSSADRIIRLVVAAVIAVLIFMNVLSGTAAVILGILAGVFAVTSVIGFCPLYTLLSFQPKRTRSYF